MDVPRCRFLVVSHQGSWFVYEVGARQPLSAFESREDAIRSARFLAGSSDGELLIMHPDGSLDSREDHQSPPDRSAAVSFG
jgi:hypothetical protein